MERSILPIRRRFIPTSDQSLGTFWAANPPSPQGLTERVFSRYANRIKNGTFTVKGVISHILENEHQGGNTLHGGFVGYDQVWLIWAHKQTGS